LIRSDFKIINAGAGSGKTFSLVLEYLTKLVNPKTELNHRSLLALTFTNKAVNELKKRILEKLFNLKTNPELELIILNHLKVELKLSENEIKSRADLILRKILLEYGSFDIITLDRFTNRIVRTFAKDFKLPSTYEIVLDSNEILSEMVESIIDKVGVDPELTKILFSFSLYEVLEGRSLDIKDNLFDFAKILLNESDIIPLESIRSRKSKTLEENHKLLNDKLVEFEKESIFSSNQVIDLILNNGLSKNDFIRGTLFNHFEKIIKKDYKGLYNNKLKSSLDGNSPLYAKSLEDSKKEKIDTISVDLNQSYCLIKSIIQNIILTKALLKNWIPLSLTKIMDQSLKEIQLDKKKILLAQFNAKISSIIDKDSVPYIFERLGERYKHYFIDEFQDTSKLQWENLVPLISNSLENNDLNGENGSLYLVGDPKQAIYRWRGGNVNQFISLYNKESPFQINPNPVHLEKNFRSRDSIVQFNNEFFTKASIFISNELHKNIFSKDSNQLKNDDPGGYVNISFIPKTKTRIEAENLYLKKIISTINLIKSRGFNNNEIAVLVRKKKQAIIIADGLIEKGIKVLTSESLLIENSEAVQFLIALFKLAIGENIQQQFKIILDHVWNIKMIHSIDYHSFVSEYIFLNPKNFFLKLGELLNFKFDFNRFKNSTIYLGLEYALSKIYFLDKNDVYTIHLLNNIFDYSIKSNKSFYSYLNYWDQNSSNLNISMPENIDAIQILTIHKAKGLEFPVVILPFLDEPFQPSRINNNIWIPLKGNMFTGLEWGLVRYSDQLKLMGDIGENAYNYYKELYELDAFSILYVAMTRAEVEMHIFTQNVSDSEALSYKSLFKSFCNLNNEKFNEEIIMEWGEMKSINNKKINSKKSFPIIIDTSSKWEERIVVTLEDKNKRESRRKGALIHELLCEIRHADQLDFVIQRLLEHELLEKDEFVDCKNTIKKVINHKKLKEYFLSEDTIINEKDILIPNAKSLRPDRLVISSSKTIIIDYKTGTHKKEDINQINEYEKALSEMNFKNIRKILVYIDDSITVMEI
jgi:ATP-dependent exoDNAse (exonuclease V) beta subunit